MAKPQDRLSAMAHCARGGTFSYGPKKMKAVQGESPETPLTPLLWEEPQEENVESSAAEPSDAPPVKVVKPTYLGQYFGGGVPRLDGSSERPSLKLRSGEPRAKSYQPAKTLGEAVAPCYVRPPKWSFGGGKSRSTPDVRHVGAATTGSLASLRRRPKSFTRGFGSGRSRPRASESPGPGAYDIFRVGDEVPVWAGSARLPWGTRTGGRSKLVHTACEVGPGEYTAQHGFQPSGPSCKLGQRLQDRKDSRIDYPAPGHYPIKSTLDLQKAFKKGRGPGIMGSGQRSTLSGKDNGPGFLYDPGVQPTTHAAIWNQGERKSWLTADPDDPPGPGAYDPSGFMRELEGRPSGWPRDEKLQKIPGVLDSDSPGAEDLGPAERLGWGIQFRGRLAPPKEEQKVSPDAYSPKMEIVNYNAGMPRPLHRTAERRSIFDVPGQSGSEALFKLKGLEENEVERTSTMYDRSGPSWSMLPRRPPPKVEDQCSSMYGPWSSIG